MPENKSSHIGSSLKPLLPRGWGRPYDHLFFDLDNTLWDFTTNSRLAMEQTMTENGLITQLSSFDSFFQHYEQINHSLWNEYHTKRITKQKLIVERFSQSLTAFGIAHYDWEVLNSQYLENMAKQTRLFPDTLQTLTYLKKKGYQMYIITNGFREVQHKKLITCGLSDYFRKVIISEDIQTTKPHRQIFEYALKSGNAQKKRSIMIGDSWDTDIIGALEFGMDQIMFLNHDMNHIPDQVKLQISSAVRPFLELKRMTRTYFIHEIAELKALF